MNDTNLDLQNTTILYNKQNITRGGLKISILSFRGKNNILLILRVHS